MSSPTAAASAPAVASGLTAAMRRHDPSSTALVADGTAISQRELWHRVAARQAELALPDRSLVVLTGSNSIESIVSYLALLDGGHVPILGASREHAERLIGRWAPTGAIAVDANEVRFDRFRTDSTALHPDLALLLSTSGSTGSPKLVRLSQQNLESNASAIASYLALEHSDVGITSLPLHYCYGLSVLHSHLLVGAAVVVTDTSVVDPCFIDAMTQHGVTNLAGVPHTFDMLERTDAERIGVPSLRLLTQAGGRLHPDAVRRWANRATECGAEFVVMYGQTEATARIAYLPAHLARSHPTAIGVPIPGGHLRIDPVDALDGDVADDAAGSDVGELVYTGPNVMMGYADDHADLVRGDDVDELRTGDLGRFDAEAGVFEIVGRRSRFVKPFGLRVDLDEVETRLHDVTTPVAVGGDDHGIVVVAPGANPTEIRGAAIAATSLPTTAITVVVDRSLPRTESGKIDHAAVRAMGDCGSEPTNPHPDPGVHGTTGVEQSVASVFASVLDTPHVRTDRSFVDLGGDSLSYVECSIRLERVLGSVPADWHLLPISTLAASASTKPEPGRFARVDTTVVLRAVGICLIVATHMRLRHVPGGAHLMLGVVGYNVARFLAPIDDPVDRIRSGARTIGRVAIPTMVWVAFGAVLFGSYSLGTFFLINNYVGPRSHAGDHWHFWFIEVFVQLVVATLLLLSIPAVRRLERRFQYGFALGLLALVYVLQMDWADMGDWYNMRYRTHAVAIFFVLGWLVHRSSTVPQRLATTLLCGAVVSGFFRNDTREAMIAGGLIMLLWLPTVPFPRLGVPVLGAVAAATMWIYITHFTFWPLLDDALDLRRDVAYVLTIAIGVAIWAIAERVEPLVVAAARDVVAHARRVRRQRPPRRAAITA